MRIIYLVLFLFVLKIEILYSQNKKYFEGVIEYKVKILKPSKISDSLWIKSKEFQNREYNEILSYKSGMLKIETILDEETITQIYLSKKNIFYMFSSKSPEIVLYTDSSIKGFNKTSSFEKSDNVDILGIRCNCYMFTNLFSRERLCFSKEININPIDVENLYSTDYRYLSFLNSIPLFIKINTIAPIEKIAIKINKKKIKKSLFKIDLKNKKLIQSSWY